MPNIQLVMCDWSGVISDDRLMVYASNMEMCDEFGIEKMSYEDWLPTITANASVWFRNRGVSLSPEEIVARYEKAFRRLQSEGKRPSMYADAPFFLNQIAPQRTTIVVSAHPQPFLEAEAKEYGIDQYFQRLYGSSLSKALTIQEALQEFNVGADTAVLIGDAISDVTSAKAAGVRSVGITTGYHSRRQLEATHPDLIVGSLSELAGYL